MKSRTTSQALKSAGGRNTFRSGPAPAPFSSACPPDAKINVQDVTDFRRGRGDLVFSVIMVAVALFFLVFFFTQTGWEDRKLPANMARYWMDQFGITSPEDRPARLGRILKQSWIAPLVCLVVLVPAALWNLRGSVRAYRWRARFGLPNAVRYELTQWARALEFVGWFIAYTMLVPVLGYLVSTLLLGTALPWRLGYRGVWWMGICCAASLGIVLVFRTGLQIRTPVNIWLYDQLPQGFGTFMKVWF
ncbi:tripartite tricarboxylate transporter TctB family protein [Tateyamaria sp. SN6-1]|uniref:tripartite tricarboxylate transporter TctB family protein n=1 Tax=Tateyamaria sp. SN6-1 TaxID=3092148 RepID=UPI0039F53EBD